MPTFECLLMNQHSMPTFEGLLMNQHSMSTFECLLIINTVCQHLSVC
jgi:hypothetical protein